MQHHVLKAGVMVQGDGHRMQVHVAMREHHTLGAGASSAGVKNFCHGVFVKPHQFAAVGRGGGQHLLVGLSGEPRGLRRSIELMKVELME